MHTGSRLLDAERALNDPHPPRPEDYPEYFRRRSAEESEKAKAAPTDFLRDQHLELAKVFARLASKFGEDE